MIYAILRPEYQHPIAYMACETPPSLEEMADHLTKQFGFVDRDAMLALNPGLLLAWALVH